MRANASEPRYETDRAAGLDLAAAIDEPLVIERGKHAIVPTGWEIAVPAGHEGQVRPRSGIAAAHRVTVLNAPGTIDADFRGECRVLLVNHGDEPFVVKPRDRIAQLVVTPVTRVEVELVDTLDETGRGRGGFGSTGR